MILLSAAVASLIGAILGSLDSCSSEIRNVTTTRTQVINTTELVVTPLATSLLLDGSGSMNTAAPGSSETKWNEAKAALPVLANAFNESMNNGTTGDKFTVSLIQWSSEDQTRVEVNQTTDVQSIQTGVSNMTPFGGLTTWGPALCECYSELESGPNAAISSKMCVLMSDGQLVPSGSDDEFIGDCTELKNACSGTITSLTQAADCLKNEMNYTIFGILVQETGNQAFTDVRGTSSCDASNCAAHNNCDCDYFLYLTDFEELEDRSATIASYQRSLATSTQVITSTSTEQISTESPVSVCSLDFLYALIAFGPFLGYLIYRVVMIKAKSKSIRKQLYEMIRNGELSRDDIRHFATVAANLLLPKNFKSDVDWIISYIMFQCPCLLPASRSDLEAVFAANTIAL